jgi:hypothetical protein
MLFRLHVALTCSSRLVGSDPVQDIAVIGERCTVFK